MFNVVVSGISSKILAYFAAARALAFKEACRTLSAVKHGRGKMQLVFRSEYSSVGDQEWPPACALTKAISSGERTKASNVFHLQRLLGP